MASNFGNALPRKHLLLTVLGLNPKPASYCPVEGRGTAVVEAPLAPVALYDFLAKDGRPDLVLAICTEAAARESWPLLEQALGGQCELKQVKVPDGETQEEVAEFLQKVPAAVPGDVELTVDFTHGFRHFSFLIYIAVLYLNALRRVPVRRAFYGLLRTGHPTRFLDLQPLLILPDWIHALRVLQETGSAKPMAEALPDVPRCTDLKRDLSRMSESYLSGLPLELGMQSDKVLRGYKPLETVLGSGVKLPLSKELVDLLDSAVKPFARGDSSGSGSRKGAIGLSEIELDRQARLIDDLVKHGHLGTALGLMSEWTVSWVMLRKEWDAEWLNYRPSRRKAAGLLGAIAAVVEGDPELCRQLSDEGRLSAEQVALGKFWSVLSQLRNAYHHHGMRPQYLVGAKDAENAVSRILQYWHGTLRKIPDFMLSLGGSSGGRILVSPIGKRPGVLFSALHARPEVDRLPDLCLVICSRDSEAGIEEAVGEAGYAGRIERLRFEDPHGGLEEIKSMKEAARPLLVGADEVLINVTGGTTLIGLAAEEMATSARELACPTVRRFGLVDRRPPVEQDEEPFVIGKPFWLDSEKAKDAD